MTNQLAPVLLNLPTIPAVTEVFMEVEDEPGDSAEGEEDPSNHGDDDGDVSDYGAVLFFRTLSGIPLPYLVLYITVILASMSFNGTIHHQ